MLGVAHTLTRRTNHDACVVCDVTYGAYALSTERLSLVRAMAVEALVPVLEHHMDDLDTQALACRTLHMLCDGATQYRSVLQVTW